MALPSRTRQSQGFGDLAEGSRRLSEDDWEVRLRKLHQVQIGSKTLYSKLNFPRHRASAACALGHMRSPGNSHQRRSIYAALH